MSPLVAPNDGASYVDAHFGYAGAPNIREIAMRLLPRLAVLLVLAAVPAGNQTLAQNWIEHKPDGIGYRIEMPAAPKILSRDVPTQIGPIKTTMALVERGRV